MSDEKNPERWEQIRAWEKEENVAYWRDVQNDTEAQQALKDVGLVAADEECDRLMDLYLAQRREHNKAVAEVERLRAALTDVSFRCERCELDFAADGIDARNRCHQCHNDVHFGQPTVQWNPILDDIGNTTITKGGES